MTLQAPASGVASIANRTRVHSLRRAGVALVFATHPTGLPSVIHWGADVGELTDSAIAVAARRGVAPSGFDQPWETTILPTEADGWGGRPALVAHRAGRPLLPRWTGIEASTSDDPHTADAVFVVTAQGDDVQLRSVWLMDAAGVVRVTHELVNLSATPLDIAALEAVLPTADTAAEVLDFSGRWTRERAPQRAPLRAGTRVRESRRGRTGHDAPHVTIVGSEGFSDDRGEVWGVHLAWSADSVVRVEALPDADPLLGAGALLRPGEVQVGRGEGFRMPEAVFVWSDEGVDGLGARLHRSLRARPAHPAAPRPVTLNTWEAVYFSHSIPALEALADVAADIGVERFVLDDGWFAGRRADNAGLGDWRVDTTVWPDGLHPLVDHVRARGMQFGLWVEPEMANPDSDLARRHPDWLLQPAALGAPPWRNQYVLDLSRPEVAAYLLESLSALVDEYSLDYLKWDQNRDVHEAVGATGDRARLFAHTRAVYAVLDELRRRHPSLEIESCASGGARVDLGIIERTDRVWASDTNDPLERLAIQRWTELLLPPELIGAHIGPPVAHTTGRATSLGFRIAVALFGSLGLEWDITSCTPEELDELRAGIAAYRRLRGMLHSGELRHLAVGDPHLHVTAVYDTADGHAVVRVAREASGERSLPPRLRIPGLDAGTRYRVRPVPELRPPATSDVVAPQWLLDGSITMTGAALAHAGIRLPTLRPAQALVLEVDAVGATEGDTVEGR
jgi:alpha-galactosidase